MVVMALLRILQEHLLLVQVVVVEPQLAQVALVVEVVLMVAQEL
jgi:hypothetical protein